MIAGKKIKCAIIGVGHIGRLYAELVAENANFDLIAVCDINLAVAEEMAVLHNCMHYQAFSVLVERELLDAVFICVPPVFHMELVASCLRHNINVLCEKPLVMNSAEGMELLRLSHLSSAVFALSTKFRYVPSVTKAKKYIEDGVIGRVISIDINFSSIADFSSRWYSNIDVSGGGVLFDNGTHAIDLMHYFLDEVGVIDFCEFERQDGLGVESTATVKLQFSRAIKGKISLSWSKAGLPFYLTIQGEKGCIHLGWKKSRLLVGQSDDVIEFDGYDKNEAFTSMLDDFAETIKHGASKCGASQMVSTLVATSYMDWLECAYRKASDREFSALCNR